MSIYTSTARFDTGRALNEDEMRKAAPSIFALSAHESRSERFQPIRGRNRICSQSCAKVERIVNPRLESA